MSFDSCFELVPLKDVTNFVNGDRSTNYPKANDYISDGIPFISAADLGDGRIQNGGVKRITQTAYDRLRSGKISVKDILFCLRGSIGKIAFVRAGETGAIASSLVIVRAGERVDPHYLYFLLGSPAGQQAAMSLNNGSAQPNLSVGQLQQVRVPLPALELQRSIAEILRSLDDRITLLRETNATLEAVAQALFKSWFVDFDPVRAKMEGRAPEGMDEATAALFPDALEESELGWVPKGWQAAKIYEVSKVIYGAPFASKLFKAERPGRPLVRIRDLKDERPGVYTEEAHPKGYLLKPGDIAVGMDGEFRAYLWGGEEAWLNQRVCVFQPINGASAAFVRCSIAPLLAAVEASETATTVIHLGKNDIDRFKVVVPAPDILAAFTAVTVPLYSRLVVGKQQAQTLATLRDTLLPRLISGQLRLPEAQALVAAA